MKRLTLKEMLDAGRLVAQAPDRIALANVIGSAERDVLAADANVATFSPWADAMLYEAGLRAARVIVQAAGYRIDSGAGAHVTAIDAADAVTSGTNHSVFVRLHRMRRRRNDFMYESTPDPSESDLTQARIDVQTVIEVARRAVESLITATEVEPADR